MEYFCNSQTFANQYRNSLNIDKQLWKLLLFNIHSKSIRDIRKSHYSVTKATNNTEDYLFKYNNKVYPFSVFSDKDLQKYDKKNLKTSNRTKLYLPRALKLACSMDLVNPRIAIGNSIAGVFNVLIIYQENGIDKVMDYSTNLIMSKNDYYELFKFNELNVIDKIDLYNIYYVINELDHYDYIYEYLIFTKEIFNELSKNDDFDFLAQKYNRNGFNRGNYTILGNDCDCLFFQKIDDYHMKYSKLIKELDSFTLNPTNKTKHISYIKNKDVYKLRAINFGCFTFKLLSNLVLDKKIKEELLSKERHGKCHVTANAVARSLTSKDKESTFIVGGKIKVNEKDYVYHSWVEIEEDNIIIDYNHNLIMNKNKYYKLYETVPISKISVFEMDEIINTVIYDAGIKMHQMDLNYFGPELMKDIKKNEKILKK